MHTYNLTRVFFFMRLVMYMNFTLAVLRACTTCTIKYAPFFFNEQKVNRDALQTFDLADLAGKQ